VSDALLLKGRVWFQGVQPRQKLMEQHIARVRSGERSVLFGMKNMAEEIDLPDRLVIIC